jgi:hypothetical protein
MAFLSTKAFNLSDRNALYANIGHGLANIVELEVFNDG